MVMAYCRHLQDGNNGTKLTTYPYSNRLMVFISAAENAKKSAIDALDQELAKVSVAAGEAKDAASRAVADGKKVVDTTKGIC